MRPWKYSGSEKRDSRILLDDVDSASRHSKCSHPSRNVKRGIAHVQLHADRHPCQMMLRTPRCRVGSINPRRQTHICGHPSQSSHSHNNTSHRQRYAASPGTASPPLPKHAPLQPPDPPINDRHRQTAAVAMAALVIDRRAARPEKRHDPRAQRNRQRGARRQQVREDQPAQPIRGPGRAARRGVRGRPVPPLLGIGDVGL